MYVGRYVCMYVCMYRCIYAWLQFDGPFGSEGDVQVPTYLLSRSKIAYM